MIRILLVDDQKSIRERLKSFLETEADFEIVGMVDNGYDAIEQVKILKPDVVLMDMEMPDIDGVLATKIINHSSPKTKVLVLSSHDSNEYVAKSIYAGAKGYLLKGAPAQEICDAVRFVERGYMQIAPGLYEQFIPNPSEPVASQLSYKPDRSISTNLNSPKRAEVTGIGIVKSPSSQTAIVNPDFDQPSELVLDVTALRTSKSIGWYQATALILAGLGLTGGLYFLRQGLNKPEPTLNSEEHLQKLRETPFKGKIEPLQVTKINATVPGFVTEIRVKVGATVKQGNHLLTIRNVDAERANQEKAIQKQELAWQQQQAAMQQASQQQQQMTQQQQILVGQKQSVEQRIAEIQSSIDNYNQTLAPLRQALAAANVRASVTATQTEKVPLRQKQEAVKRAQAIYERNLATYQRLAKFQDEGAISQERLEQSQKDMEVAKSDLKMAQADYDSAIATEKATAVKQAAQTKQSQLQQQLALKEQEGQIRQLEEQLRVAKLDHQQISSRLQQLTQTKAKISLPTPKSPPTPLPETVLAKVFATTSGKIFELPIAVGDQIFTGNKLVSVTDPRQLKVAVDVNAKQSTWLKPRQKAIVKTATGVESQELIGSIANISPPTENQTQKVEIEFTNPSDSLLLGQIATVYFPE